MRHLAGGPPGFRIKDNSVPEPGGVTWDRAWCYHTRPWETIEWLEIEPDGRHDAIVSAPKAIGVPHNIEDDRIRIGGWLRPGLSSS